jgi:hypothetical protein
MAEETTATTETTTVETQTAATEPVAGTESKTFDEDYVKGLRSEAAKHRTEAKQLASRLEELERASMSDQEKAVATARSEARMEAIKEVGGRLVDAEVRVAASGRNVDVDALLEGLNRSRFLKEDGEPDSNAIADWVDRIAPAIGNGNGNGNGKPRIPDLAQGTRVSAQADPGPGKDRLLAAFAQQQQ